MNQPLNAENRKDSMDSAGDTRFKNLLDNIKQLLPVAEDEVEHSIGPKALIKKNVAQIEEEPV
jgi:hypothetical protein